MTLMAILGILLRHGLDVDDLARLDGFLEVLFLQGTVGPVGAFLLTV